MSVAPGIVVAHGIGGRQDLPIPFSYALTGAALALVVSFVALGMLWREPRLGGESVGAVLPGGAQRVLDSARLRWVVRLAGLAAAGYVAVAAVLGPDLAINPTAGSVYVLFWVGLAPLSALLGPVWRLLNPLRTVHLLLAKALRVDPRTGIGRYPPRLGYWPAAAALLSFAWLELVAPDRTTLPVLRAYFACYIAVQLLAGAYFGQAWFGRGDGFEAYSALLGRLSPLGRRDADGRWVLRSPLDGLASMPAAPGLAAVVVVLLGSTAFDGLSGHPRWVRLAQSGALPEPVVGTLGLLGVVALVGAAYATATGLTGRLGSGWDTPTQFAHSLVPIALGYLVAHYYSLFVLEGQRTLAQLSDPLATGANVFGTAEWPVRAGWVTPTGVATLQVAAVVTGHLLGVVLAHDRAVRLLPRRHALRGQLPLLGLMVGYTVGGLWLLFAA